MKWRWVYILVPLVVLGSLIGWRLTQKQAAAAEEKKSAEARRKAPASVRTATAKRQDIVKYFEAVGSVESPNSVELTPRITGRVTLLSVREGDAVSAGQTLVRLDPSEIQAEVRQKEASVAQARSRLAEAELAQGANDVSLTSEVTRQRAAVAAAEALRRQTEADYQARVSSAETAIITAASAVATAEAEIARADAAIAAAQADLKNVRSQLARQQALLKEGAVAQQVVDNAATLVEVQEGAVNQAKEQRSVAVAARDSAVAQKRSAQRQAAIARVQSKAALESGAANIGQVRATLEAARAGTGRTGAYTKNIAALRAAVAAAEADLRLSQARLTDTELRAPLAGVVTARNLDPGGLASPNQAVLSLQDISSVWATVAVPEEVSRRLYRGQSARVSFDALPGESYAGSIAQILPAADPQSRQFTVRVRLDNPRRRIRTGMFGRVAFETQREKNALVVPLEAVQREGRDESAPARVTVVGADGKAEVRDVKVGLSDGKVAAITGGLSDGDRVVVLATRAVRDGQAVRGGSGEKKPGGSAAPGATEGQARK